MDGDVFWVARAGDRWALGQEGNAEPLALYARKVEALEAAKQLARRARGEVRLEQPGGAVVVAFTSDPVAAPPSPSAGDPQPSPGG